MKSWETLSDEELVARLIQRGEHPEVASTIVGMARDVECLGHDDAVNYVESFLT